jgi:Gram-negative bacterial TonB protein C-terminal/PilZ domain
MSATLQQIPTAPTLLPKERRFYTRITPKTPIRFAIDDHDVLMLNMSENGLLVFTTIELTANRVAHVSIPLTGLPDPLQINVRVVWANKNHKVAGIQLLNLSDDDRERVREWIANGGKPTFSGQSNQPRLLKPSIAPVTPLEAPKTSKLVEIAAPESLPASRAESSTSTPKPTVEAEPASETPIKLKWPLLGAAICLAGLFLYWAGVLGNPFGHSGKYLHTTISANSVTSDANKATTGLPSPLHEPPKSNENLLRNLATDKSARAQDAGAGSRKDQSANSAIGIPDTQKKTSLGSLPVATANPQTSLAFPLRPIQAETHDDSKQFAGSDDGASTTAPNIPPIPVPTPKPDTPVIERNVPQRQVVEVHLPGGYRSPFVDLPGTRAIDTPTVSIHMQRSVHLPPTFAQESLRDGEVVVGELVSQVDPLISAAQLGPTDFVHVHATIAEDGRVGTVTFIHGPSGISSAVVNAIRQWRYQPTLVNGQPVESQADIEVRFRSPTHRAARR